VNLQYPCLILFLQENVTELNISDAESLSINHVVLSNSNFFRFT